MEKARILLIGVPLVACLCSLACEPAAPPEPAEPPSQAVMTATVFLDAMRGTDWATCADHLHPVALEEFRRVLMSPMSALAGAGHSDRVLGLFEGVETMEQLEALGDLDFFVKYMNSVVGSQPQVRQMLSASTATALGEVLEGDDRVHVVYRLAGEIGPVRFEEVNVLGLSRDATGVWRANLPDEIKNVAQAFSVSLAGAVSAAQAAPQQ